MKIVVPFILAGLLVIFQTTWLERFSIGGVKPDLALMAACLGGLLWGKKRGTAFGFILGYLMGLSSGGAETAHLVIKTLVGFFSGQLRKTLIYLNPIITGITIALFSLIQSLILMLNTNLEIISGNLSFYLFHLILPEALYNSLLGYGVYWVVTRKKAITEILSRGAHQDELFSLSLRRIRRD